MGTKVAMTDRASAIHTADALVTVGSMDSASSVAVFGHWWGLAVASSVCIAAANLGHAAAKWGHAAAHWVHAAGKWGLTAKQM